MKICLAQTKSVKGDILSNIEKHKTLAELAIGKGGSAIFFPELSLTGYEPELAKGLAIFSDDHRLDIFQHLADSGQITIGLGAPVRNKAGVCISILLFQPDRPRQIYSKKYLHQDELPFFVDGENLYGLKIQQINIALAICYEISIPDHSERAYQEGAEIYIASVVKYEKGVDQAARNLSEIAKKYGMPVLMSNAVGLAEGKKCGGKSSVWNQNGELIGQLDDFSEGLLIFDTETDKDEKYR